MTIVVPVPLAPAPDVPNSSDTETTFDALFEAFLTYLKNSFVAPLNALSAATYSNALDAKTSAESALSSRLVAENVSAIALGSTNFKGEWGYLTGPLNTPASVAHAGRIWLLLHYAADITLINPLTSPTFWRAYDVVLPIVHVFPPAGVVDVTVTVNMHYVLSTGHAVRLIPPANPNDGDTLVITVLDLYTQTMSNNTKTIEGVADEVQFDELKTYVIRYMGGLVQTWKFIS